MTFRIGAGALATAAIAVAAFFGAGQAGAHAEAVAPATEIAAPAGEAPAETEGLPRFVSFEVVQPLPPEEESAGSLRELVAEMSAGAKLSRDMRCLAEAIYFESRGEPLAGQLAVGRVIINRADSGLFPSDYCSVVMQPGQFSFVRHGRIPAVNESSPAWDRAKAIARIAHQELWDSEAGDALYFHAKYVRPRWASRKTARATIDSHVFYR